MRSGNGFLGLVQGLMSLYQFFFNQLQAARAEKKAKELEAFMDEAQASGQLGDGRLATMKDAERAGLFNMNGLYLGTFNGRMVFFNGDGPLLTYLRTGGGKGINYVLPNLAHVRDRSLIVIDVKDGENAFATYRLRASLPGHTCICLNPFGLHDLPNTRINPLQVLIDIVNAGRKIDTEAADLAHILCPVVKNEQTWPRDGAIDFLSVTMEYLAHLDQENCNLAGLWAKVQASDEDMDTTFVMMESCGITGIARRAAAMRSIFQNAVTQWAAYKSVLNKAVTAFEAEKSLANATLVNEFDFRRLKHEPCTVYIMVRSDKLDVAAPWISLIINVAIEAIAAERGPLRTTLLLDEFAQLPPGHAFMRTLRLYRGKGVQPWVFSQGRQSLEGKWSKPDVLEIEDQAQCFTMKDTQDPALLRDISLWSGNMTVLSQGQSHSGGKLEAANASLSESKRPVLQSEDVLALGNSQIVRIANQPHLFVISTRPYFKIAPWMVWIRDVRSIH
ncbi:type IV secretory system conjugative DNA transfer family protein [Asticcacaulis sp. AND118]|uniref:type IV secretory system conjugative DNA transfer family protein n=1 Tax=Asticcacaulis sp. AND118 TaxID=2840468 RepID=UPI001CFF98B2|nr:type IV secretory system conjugative DNA transfer family protein [Asticcacaulis sp. AND118]UDF05353.1 type IV secretory system conjugative DNA transfer family protein [Asticcacaulis sp. AND118]